MYTSVQEGDKTLSDPLSGIMENCEPALWGWEWNLSSLQDEQELLTYLFKPQP